MLQNSSTPAKLIPVAGKGSLIWAAERTVARISSDSERMTEGLRTGSPRGVGLWTGGMRGRLQPGGSGIGREAPDILLTGSCVTAPAPSPYERALARFPSSEDSCDVCSLLDTRAGLPAPAAASNPVGGPSPDHGVRRLPGDGLRRRGSRRHLASRVPCSGDPRGEGGGVCV